MIGRASVRAPAFAALAGVVFAAGLALGGMTDPRKVQGFLDLGGLSAGRWDPSLAFVMGGALLVSLGAFSKHKSGDATRLGAIVELPTRNDLDLRLIGGATLFGIGWGLSAYCPGPAIASLLTGGSDLLCFLVAMGIGMLLARRLMKQQDSAE